jgi:hypothetical protein
MKKSMRFLNIVRHKAVYLILYTFIIQKVKKGTNMLEDIIFITKKVFDDALKKEENLENPKRVYSTYRCLEEVVSDINLVANHYLVHDFNEANLQNSSFGKPSDKWRFFLNQDLEKLNDSLKEYLLNLSYLSHEDMSESYINKIYNAKSLYGFIMEEYSIGFIEQNSKQLHTNALKIDLDDSDSIYLNEYNKIDVSTYELKVELKTKLIDSNKILIDEFKKLKKYILDRYTVEDLLG